MDETFCAANVTPRYAPCTLRDTHLTTCRSTSCAGCAPRPADRGHLCQRHHEQIERARTTHQRLEDGLAGIDRAITPTSSASSVAGPRLPLTTIALDLDELRSLYPWTFHTDTEEGAVFALKYATAAHATAARHPLEPRRARLHRVRCGHCEELAVVTTPPAFATGDAILTCASCGWTTRDQDHVEAATYAETLVRDPYLARRRRTRKAPGGLEQLTAIARLAKALAS